MHSAPRCSAKSKRSGIQCKAPAVRGKRVCRMHGARSGAPTGEKHGRYVHGLRTKEAVAAKREVRELLRSVRDLLAQTPH
ncbi:hypothetical protein [Neomesorhizobium albiziae]|uniref:hypothetical protein n=1 Tax=Neomesorhizobium albiziae TaxID=335020 RepID=UPI00122D4C5A|nr:hypothetical protein [Mesorhizobium albiziae]